MTTACNLCGFAKHKELYGFQGYSLVKCEKCSLCFMEPLLTHKQIKEIYSKEYYFSPDSNLFGYSDYKKEVDAIVFTAIKRFEDIEKHAQTKGRLLDIGCAYGYYLDIARLHGWNTAGIELNEESSKEGMEHLKLDIRKGMLSDQSFEPESFDVVTCWDLIEHLGDPQNFLEQVSRIIKKGGIFTLSTPDIESLPAKIMKKRWMGIKSREHQYFFSRKTLESYFEKNGFQLIESKYVGKFVSRDIFFDRLQYYFGPLGSLMALVKGLLPPLFYVNPYDILCLTAKKLI